MVIGTLFTVVIGLAVARFADNVRGEKAFKTAIFLPGAISLVGAGVTWLFVYAGPPFENGLLNAITGSIPGLPDSMGGDGERLWVLERGFGGFDPPASAPGFNTLLLIVIFIWTQAGFATVIFSAAIKGVPDELIEAAKVDGATDRQTFYKVMLPYIQTTIITVATTITFAGLKAFDIVAATTGGTVRHQHDRQRVLRHDVRPGPWRSGCRARRAAVPARDPDHHSEPECPEASRGDGGRMTTTSGTSADPFADADMVEHAIADDVDPVGHKRRKGSGFSLGSKGGLVIVSILALLWTIPTFGVFISSFRPENDVKTNGWWNFFRDPSITLDNYRAVLSSGSGGDNLWKYFQNSIIITVPAVLLSVGLALLAAYALSWIEFKGSAWMFVAIVALLMVPLQMALVPILQLFSGGAHIGSVTIFPDLNLTGTYLGVWIAHTIFGMPFCVFILKNFVVALPRDIIEAAKIDGAGHLTIFFRLVAAAVRAGDRLAHIFQFMWIWNDYLIALIYAGQDKAPITRQLATLTGTRGSHGTCSRRPAWWRWSCRSRCSSRCSASSCEACWRAPSRADRPGSAEAPYDARPGWVAHRACRA